MRGVKGRVGTEGQTPGLDSKPSLETEVFLATYLPL